jgi:enoyl-CoA hydratase
MDFESIRAEVRPGGAGVLTLHRPEMRNAISIRMRKEISACLEAWKEDPAVGVLVMTVPVLPSAPDSTSGNFGTRP